MNVARYEIALTIRRNLPVDLEPPEGTVRPTDDGRGLVAVDELDANDEAQGAALAAILERLSKIIADREDDVHNEITDTLFATGQRLSQAFPDLEIELHHAHGAVPGMRVQR